MVCVTRSIVAQAGGLSPPAGHELGEACEIMLTQSVTPDWIKKMIAKEAETPDAIKKAQALVQKYGTEPIFINKDLIKADNTNTWTKELASGGICNQKGSGRCWVFSGINLIRTMMYEKKLFSTTVNLSQTYPWFFHLLEQSNEHFERVLLDKNLQYLSLDSRYALTSEISQGGWFKFFSYLVDKYGVVPIEAMPETAATADPTVLMNDLNREVAYTVKQIELAAKSGATTDALRAVKDEGNQRIFKILTTHLGVPPTQFELSVKDLAKDHLKPGKIQGKKPSVTFTPQEFAKDYIGFKADDWVTVGNYTLQKENHFYVTKQNLGDKTSYVQLSFLNLNIERLKELTIQSIDAGIPVWYAAFVLRDVDNKSGIMHPDIFIDHSGLFGEPNGQMKNELNRNEENYFGLSAADHAMTFVGYDKPPGASDVARLKTENSWGEDAGKDGFYATYLDWFKQNVFEVVVHRDFLKPEEQRLLSQPPDVLESESDFGRPKK